MRRALCVGIDNYSFGPLQGCVSDAERVAAVLRRHHDGSPNFDCRILTGPLQIDHAPVTRPALREAIELLFRDEPDVALLHFSGHGTVNNLDGYLVTQDARKYDEGVAMSDVLKCANDSSMTLERYRRNCTTETTAKALPPPARPKAPLFRDARMPASHV